MQGRKWKAELLSPAGDIDGAVGAINAGADAIYLGTEEFSARAYAKNLTIEETIEMIHYAHLYHRKLYLTMNTLLKNVEFSRALSILERLYLAGLDAVIVQDLGLLSCLHQYFPELEIHVSTQLSILSAAGMEWLKEYHVTRVVPGRELSLAELREMKKTGLELECFIHGAMCYAYSGRCLMSSLA
ncbi:MAG: U32 family peptidase, partial [Lachnospiraceae bacterium]|nr:U32 family peptidase [Lachnospiraceae bacterium]